MRQLSLESFWPKNGTREEDRRRESERGRKSEEERGAVQLLFLVSSVSDNSSATKKGKVERSA